MQKSKRKHMSKTRLAFILFCCGVPVIEWLIFYIYGNASSFVMAFTNGRGELGLDNFVRLWEELTAANSDMIVAVKNTFISFTLLTIAFPFQVLVAYFIYKKVPGYSIYRILFFIPTILFSVASSMIIMRMFSVNGFIAEGVQALFGLEDVPELLADTRYANTTVLFHMLWMRFPGDLIIWGGTFARIPEDVLESGKMDGVTWWQEFTRIVVPIVWPTVGLKMVLQACQIFSASGAVFLLTDGEFGTMTLSCWMYKELLNGATTGVTTAYNYMSAVGLVMTIIAITISLVIRRWVDKAFEEVEY